MTAVILIGIAVLLVLLYTYLIGEIEENEEKYDEEFVDGKKEGGESEQV